MNDSKPLPPFEMRSSGGDPLATRPTDGTPPLIDRSIHPRTTRWAWVSLAGGLTAIAVWGLHLLIGSDRTSAEHPLGGLLYFLIASTGWYAATAGAVTHFLARRRIAAAERAADEELQGEFTALLGFLISVIGLMFWNRTTGPFRYAATFVLVSSGFEPDSVIPSILSIDGWISAGVLLVSLGYAAIGGPPAIRRLLLAVGVTLIPLAFFAQWVIQGRQSQRERHGEHRAGELSNAVRQLQLDHRRLPGSGGRAPGRSP